MFISDQLRDLVVALGGAASPEEVNGRTITQLLQSVQKALDGDAEQGGTTVAAVLAGISTAVEESPDYSGMLTGLCDGSITELIVPEGVAELVHGTRINGQPVGVFAFYPSLANITLPNSLTVVGLSDFAGCTGITSLEIPTGVTSIDNFAFYGCSGLTSVTLPDGITEIATSVFYGCSGLTGITIPDSVTSIGITAFSGCKGLTGILLPSGVTSIGNGAFQGCQGLAEITIPSGVTSIDHNTFNGCIALASVTLPDGVTSIGDNAFFNCTSLESITIPSGVTSLGKSVLNNCTGLTSITLEPTTPPTVGNAAFASVPTTCTIYVPADSMDAYKAVANMPDPQTYTYAAIPV